MASIVVNRGTGSIPVQRISNHVIKPVQVGSGTEDKRPILGADIIPHLYSSIFMVAKKNSGKTTVLAHLLKHLAGTDTTVIVFSATLHNDATWQKIRESLAKNKVEFIGRTSIYEPDGSSYLRKWLDSRDSDNTEPESNEEKEEQQTPMLNVRASNCHLLTESPKEETKESDSPRKRKSKYRMPETIFVFDDMSGELRDPMIANLIKRHRHYKTKIIISSQYVKDIVPATAQNIDIWFMFRGLSPAQLVHVYELASPSVPFEKFKELYNDATSEDYSFLYADVTSKSEYRKSLAERYRI